MEVLLIELSQIKYRSHQKCIYDRTDMGKTNWKEKTIHSKAKMSKMPPDQLSGLRCNIRTILVCKIFEKEGNIFTRSKRKGFLKGQKCFQTLLFKPYRTGLPEQRDWQNNRMRWSRLLSWSVLIATKELQSSLVA